MEISDDGKLTFKLPTFEGPLDLLLHLIKKNEMDIYDIPMSKITSQYIDYLHQMQSLELDIAGEYLVIAAMLVNIKSKMLLPSTIPFKTGFKMRDFFQIRNKRQQTHSYFFIVVLILIKHLIPPWQTCHFRTLQYFTTI